MKAVILAAGKGKRMLPLTLEKPKPLLEVLGKPIIAHIFDALPDAIDEVIVVTGYKGDMLRAYLGESFGGRKVRYVEQKELTGHIPALRLARQYLTPGERFLLLPADDLRGKGDLTRLISHPLAVGVHEVADPKRFGIVVPTERGTVADIEEKPEQPKGNLATTMAYVLDDSIFDYQAEAHGDGEYYLPPVVAQMARAKDIFIEREGSWIQIGYPDELRKAEGILGAKSSDAN
jgi:bifunctional UDP-N-acetylglucosamine pyrophosphorylase/glucosamine-1-phosphate N-acetyltransferase